MRQTYSLQFSSPVLQTSLQSCTKCLVLSYALAFAPEGAGVHSKEFLETRKTEAANNAILIAAKILSATVYDIISNPALLKELQEEFQRNKAQMEA